MHHLHALARCERNAVPELNVAAFALLLHFPWEDLQAPLFAGIADASYASAIGGCLQATVGDMAVMLFAYECVVLVARDRRWPVMSSLRRSVGFVAIGVAITAAIEWLAIHGHWVKSWGLQQQMPILPGAGIALLPLLQWVLVPLVA